MRAAGLPVPPGFVLGRSYFDRYSSNVRSRLRDGTAAPMGADAVRLIEDALDRLGAPVAVRRSPLVLADGSTAPIGAAADAIEVFDERRPTNRPARETYLHIDAPIEVVEAVRRVWLQALSSAAASPAAVIVQRFIPAGVSALVLRDDGDPDTLHVAAIHGVGDLLASGLVAPDRFAVRRADGSVITRRITHKALVSVPQPGGGTLRRRVPVEDARRPACEDEVLARWAELWRDTEEIVGPLQTLGLVATGDADHITAAAVLRVGEPLLG